MVFSWLLLNVFHLLPRLGTWKLAVLHLHRLSNGLLRLANCRLVEWHLHRQCNWLADSNWPCV